MDDLSTLMLTGGYMSDTLNALLVILFFALPGIAGNAIYMKATGINWREEPGRTVVRIFSISLGGLLLYVLVGSLLNAPLPSYLSLDTLDTLALRRTASIRMSIAFIGHLLAAILVGFAAAKMSQVGKGPGQTGFVDGWHEFVSAHANGHRAVVETNRGATYAGYIQMAGPEKKADERDVILAEPAVYRADQDKYLPLPYNYLFLPGKIVDSVAITNGESDNRLESLQDSQLVTSSQEGA
jgi:hypothetical protein